MEKKYLMWHIQARKICEAVGRGEVSNEMTGRMKMNECVALRCWDRRKKGEERRWNVVLNNNQRNRCGGFLSLYFSSRSLIHPTFPCLTCRNQQNDELQCSSSRNVSHAQFGRLQFKAMEWNEVIEIRGSSSFSIFPSHFK